MRILVFDADSLSTLAGGSLASVHGVTLAVHDPHTTRVPAVGLDIIGAGSTHISPAATTTGTDHSADLTLVTVKSFGTTAAADTLAGCNANAMLSLQNGLIEKTLASHLDAPIFAGTATYGARLVRPDRAECTGVGRVVSDALNGGPDPLAKCVGKAFRGAGLSTLVVTDMPRRCWEKLAVNADISAVAALARVENGALTGDNTGELAHQATRETARVARLERVSLPNHIIREAVDRAVGETATNRSLMLQDMTAEKRTEVDAIDGAVVGIAADHDFEVPTNRTLTTLLRAWKRGAGLR